MHFDIVHAADIRFRGGASSAVRTEMEAAARFGLTSALMPLVGARMGRVRRFDKRTAETFENLNIPWLTGEEPVDCDVVLAQRPFAFRRMPLTPIRVRAKRVVFVVQHPPFDGIWRPEYRGKKLGAHVWCSGLFRSGRPNVRTQFEDLVGEKPTLLRRDFFNLIDKRMVRAGCVGANRERHPGAACPKRSAQMAGYGRRSSWRRACFKYSEGLS